MLRRAVLVGAVLAAVCAPGAQAAESFKVQGIAVGSTPAVATPTGEMLLSVSCATEDTPGNTFYLYKCSVGPVRASTACGFECFGPPVATATGLAPAGQYELCVGAASFGATSKNFHKCVPLDATTNTAVITR
jgi:hypothetical protein